MTGSQLRQLKRYISASGGSWGSFPGCHPPPESRFPLREYCSNDIFPPSAEYCSNSLFTPPAAPGAVFVVFHPLQNPYSHYENIAQTVYFHLQRFLGQFSMVSHPSRESLFPLQKYCSNGIFRPAVAPGSVLLVSHPASRIPIPTMRILP